MQIVIVEDEPQAAGRLERLVKKIQPDSEIVGTVDSVRGAVKWFSAQQHPDLIFMDIQLGDGLSFEIFEKAKITAPVIFTTAYDEYALKAFKVNSIDYILKPVDEDELKNALTKFKELTASPKETLRHQESMDQVIRMLTQKYKERFVVRVGEHLRTIDVKDILYFLSQDKVTFGVTTDKRKHILDFTIEQLEGLLDPLVFFRVNRKYFVRSEAIQDMISYTNSRLKLKLEGSDDNDIIVARERVQDFKQWLDR